MKRIMKDTDLQPGHWYVSSGQFLRYEGQDSEGAYVFSKFSREKVTTVRIFNIESLGPWPDGVELPNPR